jgi:phosphoribosylglycinamide formyltransferase-1
MEEKHVNAKRKFRIGILGSGRGSNCAAIADACASGSIAGEVTIVISDIADAGILAQARQRGITALHIAPGKQKKRLDKNAEHTYIKTLKNAQVDLVVLAGFMRILGRQFLCAFPRRIINVHPALLPAFPGLEAWKQALAAGVKETGCTVHFVDDGVDTGPVIRQEKVPVLPSDTAESLHARIQQTEHKLYPQVVAAFARGEIA